MEQCSAVRHAAERKFFFGGVWERWRSGEAEAEAEEEEE